MAPSVLYYCPCDHVGPSAGPSSASSSSSATTAASTTAAATAASTSATTLQFSLQHPPSVPSTSSAAAYAFHPLESLYFCDECDQIRCSRCVAVDIAAYYCPNCLFEVPHASVKQSRNLCARNCFLCPSCTHTLSVVATDIDDDEAAGIPLTSPDASMGRPPYFLQCPFCLWDSKGVGLTFEKPTGLGRQLDKLEQSAPDLLELYHLRDHFDPFITAQTDAAQAAAALAQGRQVSAAAAAGKSGSGSSSSAAAMAGTKSRASGNASSLAASAALQKSKLLRDIPQLASGRYLTGVAEKPRPHRREEKEELKPYDAFTSWTSGRTPGQYKGVLGRREESRYDYLASFAGSDARISTLQQRWTSPWDQPVRSADLPPTRVALRCKQSKRCPTCRHIIIKPDLKAESRRFKIKLVAFNYVPEIELELAAIQPYLQPAGAGGSSVVGAAGSRLSRRTSMLGISSGSSSLRRRPISMLGGGVGGGSGIGGGGSGSGSSLSTSSLGHDLVDEEALQAGKTYVFEATFTNPLDDAMRIKLGLPRTPPTPPVPHSSTATPIMPELEATQDEQKERANEAAMASRANWSVSPSTTSFGIHAYNEVWDLDEDDLLGDSGAKEGSSEDEVEEEEDDDEHEDEEEDGGMRTRRKKKYSSSSGIVRRKGHTTTIAFDVTLGKEIKEGTELQHPVLVTYTPHPESSGGGGGGDKVETAGSPFTFWTVLRFGRVGKKVDVAAMKRATLEKRRSVLGLSSASSSPLPSSTAGGSSPTIPASAAMGPGGERASRTGSMRGLEAVREGARDSVPEVEEE
ncbi:uncharacterized protein PFL1_00811 [Pseudozyma flocculosa PF-1]|uniref:Dynactin subunit 4 n=1 Tax=Pseudozyma flocculosa TaxID=84751 RepID=A0A5C3F3Q8_9BASI|nr:uncharacterized protein PFL1_00811 [Pseudozyma flocculosa PF-1]EPQ31476.1 hypothetical protein PFL1_00811 [Pseudozyma flocculosa PF-1]SPO38740.1 related to dynactin subunit p62 [Pseudozyma flocculosa]